MEPSTNPNLFERLNNWIKESITIKLMSIGFLVLILLIPSSWIESLIIERQSRAESVIQEISTKWSGEQSLVGPILVIPFIQREKIDKGKEGIEIREWTDKAFFLPEKLIINGKVDPQILHRGIFDAAVYESDLDFDVNFKAPDFQKLNIDMKDILWGESSIIMGINDLRGISGNPILKIGNQELVSEPSSQIGLTTPYDNGSDSYATNANLASMENGIVALLPWKRAEDFSGSISLKMSVKGSTRLYFVPIGRTTKVLLQGPWASPSFDGSFLPSTREVNEHGFTAQWDILHYNRPFSQQWIGTHQKLAGSEFGVKLLIPVDQYQKSMRTSKYGAMIILLTFISLFMVEIMRKIRIHPFQYILIGGALIIYYSLLLSFSEHVGYNIAYLIATLSTIILVSLYSKTFLKERKLIFIFSFLLMFFYGFIFVIIQMQDYSLLLGSLGLFFIIGLLMYFSKNIKWYDDGPISEKK